MSPKFSPGDLVVLKRYIYDIDGRRSTLRYVGLIIDHEFVTGRGGDYFSHSVYNSHNMKIEQFPDFRIDRT